MSRYRLCFELIGLPRTTNAQSGLHWRQKAAEVKQWHRAVWAAIGSRRPERPLPRAKVSFTRFSSREPDYDGLVSSFKHLADALIESKIILDDKMSCIGQPSYNWVKVPPKRGKVRVELEEIDLETLAGSAHL